MEYQRHWVCRWFVRFNHSSRALHRSEQCSLGFSNHDYCGLGGQPYQIGFGLISRAIRIIGFRFGLAKEGTGRFWGPIAFFCNSYGKHKHCRGVEHFGGWLQRRGLRHDYSSRPLHRASNLARASKRGCKGDSDG
jgi:hypothetical protein